MLVKAVHFVSCGLTPPYKGWREKSNAMLSWCPTEGALPPGGNESRGGLLSVDLHVWEALDFKAKLPDYTTIQGLCMNGKVWGILYWDPGKYYSGMKITSLKYVFLWVCLIRKIKGNFISAPDILPCFHWLVYFLGFPLAVISTTATLPSLHKKKKKKQEKPTVI